MNDSQRLRDAMARILQVASEATTGDGTGKYHQGDATPALGTAVPHGCTIKALPERLSDQAAEHACRVNPVNSPIAGLSVARATGAPPSPSHLTLWTPRYWGPTPRQLTVSFMESTPANLRSRILSHLNAWSTTCGISFAETSGIGRVRISRGPGGFYSYLGTDIDLVPPGTQTMNLQDFTMSTPESEFLRVVRHEAGHTLGFPHEHMRKELVDRIDPPKAYQYFWFTQGWDAATVDAQVLTPLEAANIFGTPADQTSIMCYQLPASIMKDGLPIVGGLDINASDYAFAALVYPKTFFAPAPAPGVSRHEDAWPESEDVKLAM